jgi:hypothetical protein
MELKVKIPDGIAALAKERGVRVEEYVEKILAEQLVQQRGNGGSKTERPRNPEEIRAWLDSLAQFSDKIPPLPEMITRDWIYQEHE